MPFEVFRQHQKKLIAIFGIMAMFAFVLSDSAYRFMGNDRNRGANSVVVDVFGKPVYRADLEYLAYQRRIANRVWFELEPRSPNRFGGYTTRELVDGKILEHEADRLGIPKSPDLARRQLLSMGTSPLLFDAAVRRSAEQVSGEEVLSAMSSQLRLVMAQQMLAPTFSTPLDGYETYRDQSEKSTFKVLGFPVESYLNKVGEPSDSDLALLFDIFKNTLADPQSPSPGFKIPRKVTAEVIGADAQALAKTIREKLTEADLKEYYETRKADFALDGETTGLPLDLFADDAKATLTPQRYQPFADIKEVLTFGLAEQRARDQVSEKFAKIRDEAIDPFSDKYHEAADEIAEAKKEGVTTSVQLPTPTELKALATGLGLTYELSPPLSQLEAENYGLVALATNGGGTSGERFADILFNAKTDLYDGFELADPLQRRYLVRKMSDQPARMPGLSEVRDQVVRAWKLDRARPMAEADAKKYADKVKAAGGTIKDAVVDGKPVIQIDSVSRMRAPFPGLEGPMGAPTPTDLPQIPTAGSDFIASLFDLKTGQVAVLPDQPKLSYYVQTLDRRDPINYDGLFGPSGTLAARFYMPTLADQMRTAVSDSMKDLRKQAGLPDNWIPPEEAERAADSVASN